MRKDLIYKILLLFLLFLISNITQVFASKEDLEEDTYLKSNGKTSITEDQWNNTFAEVDENGDDKLSNDEVKNASDNQIGILQFGILHGNVGGSSPKTNKRLVNSRDTIETEFNNRRDEYDLSSLEDSRGSTGYDKFYSPKKVGEAGTTGSNLENIMDSADEFVDEANDTANVKTSALQDFSNTFYGIFLAVATAVTVIVGIIIGIKYMVSSAGERANVKQMLVPYAVGCVVVYGSFGIWALVVSLLNNV